MEVVLTMAIALPDEPQFNCSICLCGLIDESEPVLVMCEKCKNVFHKVCADQVLSYNDCRGCPLCKYDKSGGWGAKIPWFSQLPSETFIPSYIREFNIMIGDDVVLTPEQAMAVSCIFAKSSHQHQVTKKIEEGIQKEKKNDGGLYFNQIIEKCMPYNKAWRQKYVDFEYAELKIQKIGLEEERKRLETYFQKMNLHIQKKENEVKQARRILDEKRGQLVQREKEMFLYVKQENERIFQDIKTAFGKDMAKYQSDVEILKIREKELQIKETMIETQVETIRKSMLESIQMITDAELLKTKQYVEKMKSDAEITSINKVSEANCRARLIIEQATRQIDIDRKSLEEDRQKYMTAQQIMDEAKQMKTEYDDKNDRLQKAIKAQKKVFDEAKQLKKKMKEIQCIRDQLYKDRDNLGKMMLEFSKEKTKTLQELKEHQKRIESDTVSMEDELLQRQLENGRVIETLGIDGVAEFIDELKDLVCDATSILERYKKACIKNQYYKPNQPDPNQPAVLFARKFVGIMNNPLRKKIQHVVKGKKL